MGAGVEIDNPAEPKSPARCWRALLGAACAYLMLTSSAHAQRAAWSPANANTVAINNGSVVEWPKKFASSFAPPPISRYTGLRISVDARWTNTYGYRPVEVTVLSPVAVAKTDRVITIDLRAGWERKVAVQQEFVLPAGAASATTMVSMPIYQSAQNCFSWDVWIDGVKDKDLSLDIYEALSISGGIPPTATTSATFLVAGPSNKHRTLVGTNSLDVAVLTLGLGEFPTRWIDYSALDVVSLSLGELNLLAMSNPAGFEALGQWVRTGGQLWICDVGTELEHLPEVSKMWQLPEAVVADESADDELKTPKEAHKESEKPKEADKEKESDGEKDKEKDAEQVVKSGWHALRYRKQPGDGQFAMFMDNRNGMHRATRDAETIARLQSNPNFVKTEERSDPNGENGARRAADSSPWFVEQRLGLGKLRAYRGDNEVALFPLLPATGTPNAAGSANESFEDLPRALAVGLRRMQHWDARHGMTPESANTEFAKFLVPGVGMAPVTYFQVLITVFVLLIGPANYWILKRYKRLHLMVLTVPLAAGITTLALFAYAILADGFETRVRADSFTTLDQRTGEAACWSRLSYYSGLAPGNGLSMPTDVTLYPILPAWAGDLSAWEERDIEWSDEGAQLKQGWLNSRTPTQYLTICARKTPHRIEMLESENKLRVKNQLGAPIKTLVVINSEGNFFLGENIAQDSSASLKTITRDEAGRLINKRVVENTPQAPPELAVADTDVYAFRSRARYQPYWRYGLQQGTSKLSENLARTEISSLAGLNGQPALELPPRSYVAITETGAEVEFGVSNAREEASFHVTEGRW
ncbi:MAG TPA: hypothetical protein VH107_05830 [Lacipirellulaceae bacterium]|nr:hypothetical protein [Lacipirellulaceae bacterium]